MGTMQMAWLHELAYSAFILILGHLDNRLRGWEQRLDDGCIALALRVMAAFAFTSHGCMHFAAWR